MKTNPTSIRILFIFLMIQSSLSCGKSISGEAPGIRVLSGPAKLSVFLTDDPSLVFDKVNLDIRKLEVKLEGNGNDSLEGWLNLDMQPGIYDVLRFRNGTDTLIASGVLPTGSILRKIRLTLGDQNTVERNGAVFNLIVKDNSGQVTAELDETNVEVNQAGQIRFWIDIDAGRSIKINNSGPGNNNGYELRSHIRIFSKSKTGSIEGKVFPPEARPVLMAYNATDTSTARPDAEGEFRIAGLKPGVYSLFIDATAGNYRDTTLTSLLVREKEDTHTGVIRLRQ